MAVISETMDNKVIDALKRYNEYQVARMYNLRVGAVRAIKMERIQSTVQYSLNLGDSPTGRNNKRRNDELMQHALKSVQARISTPKSFVTDEGDYASLEKRAIANLAGTTGHLLLDTLREHEIYNQKQLLDALDIDKQADSLPAGQALLLARRLLDKVYSNYVNNQTSTSTDVPDC